MDISVVRTKKVYLQTELSNYLRDPVKYQKEITVTRGRLLRILYKEYKLETDVTVKSSIKNEITTELNAHKIQLNNRINRQDVKESMFKQIPRELGLKFKKVVANIKSIKYANSGQEKVGSGLKAAGNVLSMGGTILKTPVVGTLRLASKLSPALSQIIVLPLHIPGLVGHVARGIITPDKKYTGQWVKNMGNGLSNQLNKLLKSAEQGIRKL